MHTRIPTALLLFVVLVSAAPAWAQQRSPDARWAPWLGCWQLVDENQRAANPEAAEVAAGAPATSRSARDVSVCVTPAREPEGITLKTLVSNQPAFEQTIVADGADHSIADTDCRGTQNTAWSRTGLRLLAHAQLVCGDQPRKVSGFAMIAGNRIWVDVQVVEISGRESIRVRRYRRAADQGGATIASPFGAPLTIDDVKEASGNVSPRAVEAALIATNARFDLNSRQLIELDDAGVPGAVIDFMVALSYPERFVVERTNAGGTGGFFAPGDFYLGSWLGSAAYPYSPYLYGSEIGLYDAYYYSPFAYSYWGGAGTQYVPGAGFVTQGGGGSITRAPDNGGRAIDGVGYVRVRPREASGDGATGGARQGGNASDGGNSSTRSDSSSGSSGGSSSGGVSSGGFSSGSSSSDTGRTAEPR